MYQLQRRVALFVVLVVRLLLSVRIGGRHTIVILGRLGKRRHQQERSGREVCTASSESCWGRGAVFVTVHRPMPAGP